MLSVSSHISSSSSWPRRARSSVPPSTTVTPPRRSSHAYKKRETRPEMLWPEFPSHRLRMVQTEMLCRWMDKACPRLLSQRLSRHRQSTLIKRVALLHLLICCYQTVVNPTKAPDTRGLGNSRFLAGHASHPELGTLVPWRPLNCR
jgi:hypothetical protein